MSTHKNKKFEITLVRSPISTLPNHKKCLKGLGLRRMHQTVQVLDTPCNQGMINKVSYLLSIKEV